MAKIVLDLETRIKGLEQNLDKVNKKLKGVGDEGKKSSDKVNKSFDSVQKKTQKFAAYFGAAIGGAAVVGTIKKSIDAMKEFEQSFTNVLTLLSAAERQKFGGFLKEGSLDIMKKYGFAVQDVNKALFDSISAGVKAGDSINFMNQAAKLATGGVTSLGVAVDGMTSIMNAYNLEAKDAEKVSAAFFSAQRAGKCFAKGTEILMYDGSIKKVEDIVVGDQLMGDDSTPRNVLGLGRGKEMMYKITMRDGSSYTVNESHILSLKRRQHYRNYVYKGVLNRKHIEEKITNIPIFEYLKKSNDWKARNLAYKAGVELPEREVHIKPYFLGLWLGDGHSAAPRITSMDKEIIDYIIEQCHEYEWNLKKYELANNKADVYSIAKPRSCQGEGSFVELLHKYNLLDNKHIPEDYMINSRDVRLELLAGLIDTDGSISSRAKNDSYEFSNKNKQIIDSFVWIARSCGFYASTHSKIINGDTYYRVYVSGNVSDIPCRVERKKAHKKEGGRDVLMMGFTVEQVGVGDYYGFSIDGNRLFLLNHFNVTHNTTVEELANNIGKLAPITASANIPFQEMLTALSLLTTVGISTEEATTGLRATVSALINPSRDAAKTFSDLGIETGLTALRANGLGKTLLQVAKAAETDADKLSEMIPNVRALTAVSALGEEALAKYDVILKQVNEDYGTGSSLSQAYILQQQTVAKAIDRIRQSAKATLISLGEAFGPLIKGFANLVAPIEKTSAALRAERSELNLLVASATNAAASEEARARAIEGLQAQYPDFLGNLDSETVTNEQLRDRLVEVNAEYEKRIQLAVQEELMNRQAKERADLLEKEDKALQKIVELEASIALSRGINTPEAISAISSLNAQIDAENRKIENSREKQEELNEAIKRQIALVSELREESDKGGDEDDGDSGGIPVVFTPVYDDSAFKKSVKDSLKDVTDSFMGLGVDIGLVLDDALTEVESLFGGFDDEADIWLQNWIEKRKQAEEQATEDLAEAEQKRENIKNAAWDSAFQLVDTFSAFNEAAMNKELAEAGDNEKKKEEIRKKYAKKEQNMAVLRAMIAGAEGIVKTGANLGYPQAIPFQIVQGLQTLAQIALIKSQKFEKGGYEVLGGKRHSEGGTMVPIGEAEKGEGHAIFSRWATEKYGGVLPSLVNSINRGEFPHIDMDISKNLEAKEKLMKFMHRVSLDDSKQLEEIKNLLSRKAEHTNIVTDKSGNSYMVTSGPGFVKRMRIK